MKFQKIASTSSNSYCYANVNSNSRICPWGSYALSKKILNDAPVQSLFIIDLELVLQNSNQNVDQWDVNQSIQW